MARSLAENRGQARGARQVRALERQVETFGFHLAQLDVRFGGVGPRCGAAVAVARARAPLDAAVLERALVTEHTPRAPTRRHARHGAVAHIRAVTAKAAPSRSS